MNKFIIALTGIIIFILPSILCATEKGRRMAHMEIPGDYEEIVVFDNGKEILRKRVEKNSEEEKAIINPIQQKIFKRLGVNSENELIKRRLWSKYKEQSSKELKIINIPATEPNRIRFIDEKGALKKEIIIGEDMRLIAMKDFVDEVGKIFPLDDPNRMDLHKLRKERPEDKLRVRISRLAYINKSKNYLASIENRQVIGIENSDEFFRIILAGKIIYMDAAGRELWQKYFKDGETILGIGHSDGTQISDNGDIVTVMTTASEEGPGEEQLHVFNKLGNEIFTYPKDGETTKAPRPSDHKISPNGRYLCYQIERRAYSTEPPNGQIIKNTDEESNKAAIFEKLKKILKTVFWDLKENTTWETEAYLVYGISNDGIVKVGNLWESGGSKLIDLKPNLRKP